MARFLNMIFGIIQTDIFNMRLGDVKFKRIYPNLDDND